jgi:hypothetical protein
MHKFLLPGLVAGGLLFGGLASPPALSRAQAPPAHDPERPKEAKCPRCGKDFSQCKCPKISKKRDRLPRGRKGRGKAEPPPPSPVPPPVR